MSDVAIEVRNLGKRFRIGNAQPFTSIRESVSRWITAPFKKSNGHSPVAEPVPDKSEFWALKDVSFDVKKGEVVGIIGRNGAGKSTLLKILSRITDPTEGYAEIHGRIGSLLEVGTGFHPELTGGENIMLNGTILGMTRFEVARKFDEIIAFSEIEKFIDTPVKHYSSGMYTRLAFAVAAHLEPEILIVDEVLAVGDAAFQKKCLGKMNDIAKHGRTVLFVSHNMEAVRKLCTRAIYLQQGEVDSEGIPKDVIERYIAKNADACSRYEIARPESNDVPGYAYELLNEDATGSPAVSVHAGEAWQVRIRFRILRSVKHFICALGMTNAFEVPLRTAWSEPTDIGPGEYEAVFREELLFLAAGRYRLTVGLSSNENTFHYKEDAGCLEIEAVSRSLNVLRVTAEAGVILNPMKISVTRRLGVSVIQETHAI